MRPKSIWRGSPNMNHREPGRAVTCVVLHATMTNNAEIALARLCDPKGRKSVHYLVARDGTLYSLVAEKDVAWHAGNSQWRGEMLVNKFSVGVDLVNVNDGEEDYPHNQLAACADLCTAVCKDNRISIDDVVGHDAIAPKRYTDPAGFPWVLFRAMLVARGTGV